MQPENGSQGTWHYPSRKPSAQLPIMPSRQCKYHLEYETKSEANYFPTALNTMNIPAHNASILRDVLRAWKLELASCRSQTCIWPLYDGCRMHVYIDGVEDCYLKCMSTLLLLLPTRPWQSFKWANWLWGCRPRDMVRSFFNGLMKLTNWSIWQHRHGLFNRPCKKWEPSIDICLPGRLMRRPSNRCFT